MRQNVDQLLRITLSSLITKNVYLRDNVKHMIANGVKYIGDFDWLVHVNFTFSYVIDEILSEQREEDRSKNG